MEFFVVRRYPRNPVYIIRLSISINYLALTVNLSSFRVLQFPFRPFLMYTAYFFCSIYLVPPPSPVRLFPQHSLVLLPLFFFATTHCSLRCSMYDPLEPFYHSLRA